MMGFIDNVAPSSVDIQPERLEDGKELPNLLDIFIYFELTISSTTFFLPLL